MPLKKNERPAMSVGLQVPLPLVDYYLMMLENGLLEGDPGKQKAPKEILVLIDAIHQVLAGGEAKVEIQTPGDPEIVAALEHCLDETQRVSNIINGAAGYYTTISV